MSRAAPRARMPWPSEERERPALGWRAVAPAMAPVLRTRRSPGRPAHTELHVWKTSALCLLADVGASTSRHGPIGSEHQRWGPRPRCEHHIWWYDPGRSPAGPPCEARHPPAFHSSSPHDPPRSAHDPRSRRALCAQSGRSATASGGRWTDHPDRAGVQLRSLRAHAARCSPPERRERPLGPPRRSPSAP